ncbi:MAG TPA: phage tail tape measure protein [Dissulfurispiraceae bacterium]|nr:phage tail tape measure protein [Dissulfurispiraceae bacterium]
MADDQQILEVVLQLRDEMSGALAKIGAQAGKTGDGFSKAGTKAEQLQAKLSRVGSSMQTIGRNMSLYVTAPILAAGAASIKFSNDFGRTMSQMTGLAGVAKEQTASWKPEILALGTELGKLPTELADAMYFIASSGFKGAAALDVLKQSAMASTAGLGETKVIADAVTSAINAYGAANLTATETVDTLTAAVREGKMEADAFAGVMGRVLPTAAALDISFEQIAGMLAVFSRTGVDAAEGATQLNAIMSAMLSTSPKAVKALDSVGLSMKDLRDMAAKPNGLITVMRTLEERLGGDEEKFAMIIPNVRAFRGVMNALAQDTEVVNSVLAGVADATGAANHAFQTAAETQAFTWDQFKAQLQATAIVAGDTLAPALSSLLKDSVIPLLQSFSELSPEMQKFTIGAIGAVAAIGPLATAISAIAKSIGFLAALKLPAWLLTLLGAGGATGSGAVAGVAGTAGPLAGILYVLSEIKKDLLYIGSGEINWGFLDNFFDGPDPARIDESFSWLSDWSETFRSRFQSESKPIEQQILDWIYYLTDLEKQAFLTAGEAISAVFNDTWESLLNALHNYGGQISSTIGGWASTFNSAWESAWSGLGSIVDTIWQSVVTQVGQWGLKVGSAIATAASQWMNPLTKFGNWFTLNSFWPDMWQTALEYTEKYADLNRNAVSGMLSGMTADFTSFNAGIIKQHEDTLATIEALQTKIADIQRGKPLSAKEQAKADAIQAINDQIALLRKEDTLRTQQAREIENWLKAGQAQNMFAPFEEFDKAMGENWAELARGVYDTVKTSLGMELSGDELRTILVQGGEDAALSIINAGDQVAFVLAKLAEALGNIRLPDMSAIIQAQIAAALGHQGIIGQTADFQALTAGNSQLQIDPNGYFQQVLKSGIDQGGTWNTTQLGSIQSRTRKVPIPGSACDEATGT